MRTEIRSTSSLFRLCYIPPHRGGDKDFAGDPWVKVTARLFVKNQSQIWASVFMRAEEPKGDRTVAYGVYEEPVFFEPYATVKRIVSRDSSSVVWTGGNPMIVMPQDDMVEWYSIQGDSRGDDAGITTGVTISFRPVKYELEYTNDKVYKTTPSQTPRYIPPHVGGDTDFCGHGPNVNIKVNLLIKNSCEIWASVYMKARETKPDYTEVKGTREYLLCKHSRPIRKILSGTESSASTVLNGHGASGSNYQYVRTYVQDPVSLYTVVGDTVGNEAGTKTGVSVEFREITFEEV